MLSLTFGLAIFTGFIFIGCCFTVAGLACLRDLGTSLISSFFPLFSFTSGFVFCCRLEESGIATAIEVTLYAYPFFLLLAKDKEEHTNMSISE
ncbi:hypothetical protein D3C80_1388060 [compost metagenome]